MTVLEKLKFIAIVGTFSAKQHGGQELNVPTDNIHMPMIVINIPNFGRKSWHPLEGDD
jgi:hypothetical protein